MVSHRVMGKFVYNCLYTTRSLSTTRNLTVTRKSSATWNWKATRVAIRGANESGYFGGLMIYKFLLNLIKPYTCILKRCFRFKWLNWLNWLECSCWQLLWNDFRRTDYGWSANLHGSLEIQAESSWKCWRHSHDHIRRFSRMGMFCM